jgi:pyruvate kinase
MTVVTNLDLLKYRRTKIVATIGPASSSATMMSRLIDAGVDVFRVNFSHGTHEQHGAEIATIQALARERNRSIGILADLGGPKIRCGRFPDGPIRLSAGAEVTMTTRDVPGAPELIPSQYADLHRDLTAGHRVLLADGLIELEVLSVSGTEIRCRVIAGGELSDHKGINLPGATVSAPSLTEKDRDDARFALQCGVDFVALSFVRTANDVAALREVVEASGKRAKIIAKIEKPQALTNSAAIIAAADGIMVARGDLGVELNPEQVPLAQSQLIDQARAANKPVIVATQMLESMITNARPTRAEVTDVANAVAARADAVMLSGESAVGRYPVEAVRMMDRVARQTETYQWHTAVATQPQMIGTYTGETPFGDAVADAAAHMVHAIRAHAVLVITQGGMSAATVSAARPDAPIVAISSDRATCRALALMWGIIPHFAGEVGHDNPNMVARRAAKKLGLAQSGEYIVLVRGFSSDPELNSPTITLLAV